MRVQDYARRVTFDFPGMESLARLREMILYIADKCTEDPGFGATKLNKILYFADFSSYARYGQPITGVKYMRLEKGPVPQALLPIRNDMEEKGEVFVKKQTLFSGNREQHRVIALREPNLDLFRARDIAVVDEIIHLLWGKTADEVSNMSHGIAWHVFGNKQLIPYQTAHLSNEGITDGDIIRAQELIMEHGWDF